MAHTAKIIVFITATFILGWGIIAFKFWGGDLLSPLYYESLSTIHLLTPALMAIIIQIFNKQDTLFNSLFLQFKINVWLIGAVVLPLAIILFTYVTAILFPWVEFSTGLESFTDIYLSPLSTQQKSDFIKSINQLPYSYFWVTLLQGLLSGASLGMLMGLGAEIGWRGFLLRQFECMGRFNASLLVGLISGLWYIPQILFFKQYFPQNPGWGVVLYVFNSMLLGPIYAFITYKAQSVWAAALFYGVLHHCLTLAFMLCKGGNDVLLGIYGVSGISGILIVLSLVMDYDKQWAKEKIFVD